MSTWPIGGMIVKYSVLCIIVYYCVSFCVIVYYCVLLCLIVYTIKGGQFNRRATRLIQASCVSHCQPTSSPIHAFAPSSQNSIMFLFSFALLRKTNYFMISFTLIRSESSQTQGSLQKKERSKVGNLGQQDRNRSFYQN